MKHNSILFFILLLLGSCTVYKEYPIEVFKPGEIAVPPDADDLAIVYRNFKYEGDTLQHYYKDNYRLKKAKTDPQNLDSLLVNICINELAKNLKENNTFEQIHIFPSIFKPHVGKNLPALDFGLVNKLTSATETELLISLETFSYFFSEYPESDNSPKEHEVITAAVWAVYNPSAQKLIERKTMIDTVFWNGYDNAGNYQQHSQLPPRQTALKIASQLAGENYSKRFFSSWQSVKRMYSVPPLPDFSAADELVQKGDWDSAIMLWKRYADEKNGKMAINARYNLALAYEMKDDIATAERWLIAAKKVADDYRSREDQKMIMRYYLLLEKRKKDIERLNQMQ